MKDYYKIAKELGLDAENTDFETLINVLMEIHVNEAKENKRLIRQLIGVERENERLQEELSSIERYKQRCYANWDEICKELDLRPQYTDPIDMITELKRENERLCQLIDNPR